MTWQLAYGFEFRLRGSVGNQSSVSFTAAFQGGENPMPTKTLAPWFTEVEDPRNGPALRHNLIDWGAPELGDSDTTVFCCSDTSAPTGRHRWALSPRRPCIEPTEDMIACSPGNPVKSERSDGTLCNDERHGDVIHRATRARFA